MPVSSLPAPRPARPSALRGLGLAGAAVTLLAAGCGGSNQPAGQAAGTSSPAPASPSVSAGGGASGSAQGLWFGLSVTLPSGWNSNGLSGDVFAAGSPGHRTSLELIKEPYVSADPGTSISRDEARSLGLIDAHTSNPRHGRQGSWTDYGVVVSGRIPGKGKAFGTMYLFLDPGRKANVFGYALAPNIADFRPDAPGVDDVIRSLIASQH
jgi:hypothetical protein